MLRKKYFSYHDSILSTNYHYDMQYQLAFFEIKSLQESQPSNTILYRHVSEIGIVGKQLTFCCLDGRTIATGVHV
jgi:hypothetical protein